MKTKIMLIVLSAICFGYTALAQTRDGYNMWYQYLMAGKLTNKSTLTALTQYRSYDFAYDTRLFLVSTYVDYEIVKGVKPAAGFMFLVLRSHPDEDTDRIRYEKRPFQQVTLNGDIGRVGISHRFRVEERFLSNPDELIMRFRYLISMNIPFYREGEKEKFYGIFKNEVRINALRDGAFDSNRITAGVGLRLGRRSAIEGGFVCQLEEGPASNYGTVVYRNNFDWRKKSK